MFNTEEDGWERYRHFRCDVPTVGLTLDISRVRLPARFIEDKRSQIASALVAMQALERGAIANPTERRMVGHYWLRASELAPTNDLRQAIEDTIASVRSFASGIRAGGTGPQGAIEHVIHVGIGGSSLGPQMICHALRSRQGIALHFIDNVDHDAVADVIEAIGRALPRTLVSIVSKSGWTPTPRHVQRALEGVFSRSGLKFARHAVATTVEGSPLDQLAIAERWLARFPIWEWVGGRTSVTSAVGLLPAALQGTDIDGFLAGAAAMDRATRQQEPAANPAALLALAWVWLSNGPARKHMVVLPYRDRLSLLPRYVQQLVMESLGKEHDRAGRVVRHGLTVYGNKGVTDQHAYLQQIFEGPDDCFVTFVTVDSGASEDAAAAIPEVTLGDYLACSSEATRGHLHGRGRDSITLGLAQLTPASLGGLVALWERAVGLYAELIDVNAYDQPSVHKGMADDVVALQRAVVANLRGVASPRTAEEVAAAVGEPAGVETVFRILERLARTPGRGVRVNASAVPFDASFWWQSDM